MRVLAFDTATPATVVALADVGAEPGHGGLWLELRDDPPPGARPGHTQRLLALIEEVVATGGGWDAIELIAVGVGPGTFTGLRIGIATARALARGRGIRLAGVSTLASLAAAARARAPGSAIVALIDARRREAFAAAWAVDAAPLQDPPLIAPCVLTPAELAAAAAALESPAIAVGDGAIKFRAVLEPAGIRVPPDGSELHLVSAREHSRLAARAAPNGSGAVLPAYLRVPDAELTGPRCTPHQS